LPEKSLFLMMWVLFVDREPVVVVEDLVAADLVAQVLSARGEQKRSPTFEIPKFASRRVSGAPGSLRLEARRTAEPAPGWGRR